MSATIGKLSRLTRVCTIYRGPGGVTPRSFWEDDGYGCAGGVEMALMSCSKNKEEALKYVRRSKAKLLFEIHQGATSRGAEVAWLSQFPAEDEVLFAPLTALEVQSTRVEGRVLVVEIRPGCAKYSLMESSIDQKVREQRKQQERDRLKLQHHLAKRRWRGSLTNYQLAKANLEGVRTKEALAREAMGRAREFQRQSTEFRLVQSEVDQKEALLRASQEEVVLAEKELKRPMSPNEPS